MKEFMQNGDNFVETRTKDVPIIYATIKQPFNNEEEAIDFLKNHGEIAETSDSIAFKINDQTFGITITENFSEKTYMNLERSLKGFM